MKYKEGSEWDFCTYKDRRFNHEVINDVKNPEIETFNQRLFKQIPEGTYDTGDGFYDPEKGTVFSYDNKFLRIPNEEEEHWIELKCRYNPRKIDFKDENNAEMTGANDEVIQNIAREFKFRKYVK